MSYHSTRRQFVRLTAAAGLAGLGDFGFLSRLPSVAADETRLPPGSVQFSDDVEPLVRLLEETPRERLLEEVAARIRQGAEYRQVLAALQLAGIRNVQPRPSVGFKFHAVLVVNSAHLASLASPPEHRWLPIFWAIDHFKESQAQDTREGNWTMPAADESTVATVGEPRAALSAALDRWDESAGDAAAAALARGVPQAECFELLARYGSRDFRSIGHKAIYVANAFRTLDEIGWQPHGEPLCRSLVYAMLNHERDGNPADADLPADRPGRENVARAALIRADWSTGRLDDAATADLLAALRTASAGEACEKVVEVLNAGVAPQSVWDALFVGAGELLARQPGIVGLHAVTTTNALHYHFTRAAADENRRWLLLQSAAFLPMFREAMQGRGQVRDFDLAQLQPEPVADDTTAAVDAICGAIGGDNDRAARQVLAFAAAHEDPRPLIDATRLLVFLKGNNAHDYKFSAAVLEDYAHVSPAWRGRYLAAGVYNLRGSGGRDNDLVARTRAALGS
jgi:hypothetical protein